MKLISTTTLTVRAIKPSGLITVKLMTGMKVFLVSLNLSDPEPDKKQSKDFVVTNCLLSLGVEKFN